MNKAVLNNELIAIKAGDITIIIMMVKRGNIFPHQLNILRLASVSRHALV